MPFTNSSSITENNYYETASPCAADGSIGWGTWISVGYNIISTVVAAGLAFRLYSVKTSQTHTITSRNVETTNRDGSKIVDRTVKAQITASSDTSVMEGAVNTKNRAAGSTPAAADGGVTATPLPETGMPKTPAGKRAAMGAIFHAVTDATNLPEEAQRGKAFVTAMKIVANPADAVEKMEQAHRRASEASGVHRFHLAPIHHSGHEDDDNGVAAQANASAAGTGLPLRTYHSDTTAHPEMHRVSDATSHPTKAKPVTPLASALMGGLRMVAGVGAAAIEAVEGDNKALKAVRAGLGSIATSGAHEAAATGVDEEQDSKERDSAEVTIAASNQAAAEAKGEDEPSPYSPQLDGEQIVITVGEPKNGLEREVSDGGGLISSLSVDAEKVFEDESRGFSGGGDSDLANVTGEVGHILEV